jgi:photosystem II stability/assembly factor-like uncharacterized protein
VLYTTTNEAWLTDLVFFPGGHGLVIGHDWTQIGGYTGWVLSVDDAGGAVIYSQYRLFLRALSAPSENHVYAAAYEDHPLGDPVGGAVLYTHSGGDSWSYVALPEDDARVDPYDIFFPTPTEGWVVGTAGEEGLLFKSTDSGVTWSPHENFAERSEHLSTLNLVGGPDSDSLFAAQSAGYAAFPCDGGCPGVVVGSSDGGASWQRVEVLSGIWSQELALVPSYVIDQALVLGRLGDDDAYLPYSPLRYPAGLRLRAEGWLSPFAVPANLAENFVDWRGLDLGDRDSGWATADHWEKEGKTWHTSDQGDTWAQQTTPAPSGAGDLAAINSVRAWAVDYVIQWGTSTWQYVSRLLTTSDGGDHWEEADVPLAAYAPDADRDARVTALDADHGCVLNEPYGAVKCTSDGWSSYTSRSLGCWGLDVAMWDQERAWALCYDLEEDVFEVWRTTDGGESWTLKSDIDPAGVSENEDDYTLYGHGSALSLRGGPRGWFAHHTIWETDDAGSSWERAFDGIHSELGISLLETTPSGMGWAATPSGTVLRWAPLGIQMVLVQGGGSCPRPMGPVHLHLPRGRGRDGYAGVGGRLPAGARGRLFRDERVRADAGVRRGAGCADHADYGHHAPCEGGPGERGAGGAGAGPLGGGQLDPAGGQRARSGWPTDGDDAGDGVLRRSAPGAANLLAAGSAVVLPAPEKDYHGCRK